MVSVGSVVVIMSFCGCCGICTETAWLVQLYSIGLIIILVAEIGVVVATMVLNKEFEDFWST